MVYRCKGFLIEELVHPQMFKRHTEDELWEMVQNPMLRVIDRIKELVEEKYGAKVSININTWKWGGGRINSGWRINWGSTGSTHRFCCGYDLTSKTVSAGFIHEVIRENQQELYDLGLRRVEDLKATTTERGTQWTHVDGKYEVSVPPGKIYWFNPKRKSKR